MFSPRFRLTLEFLFIYFAVPVMFTVFIRTSPVILLVTLGTGVFIYLRRSYKFDNRSFYAMSPMKKEWKRIFLIFTAVALLLLLFTWILYPQYMFALYKYKFLLWCIIMFAYPLISVYPQELIFRGFLMTRYRGLFSKKALLHVSAFAFSFAHIVYFNPVAIILTLGGGYLFAWTYRRTGSVMICTIEHALYGCAIFTIGLGRFFYNGFS